MDVTAEWRRLAGELRTSPATVKGHQTLEFPGVELPPNHDIRVRLTRHDGRWDTWFFPAQLAGRPIFGIGVCCSDMTFHSIDWRAAAD